MKIWCLRCGRIVAHAHECEFKETECPICGLEMKYSVENNVGHVSVAVKDVQLGTNNDLYIYNLCS